MKRILLIVAILAIAALSANAATITVSPSDMQGWAFVTESGAGTGSLVNGPGTPPAGTGSAQLETPASGDRILLATLAFEGLRFDQIAELKYSTYRSSGGSPLAPSLQFDVDTDLTDANGAWQGRLVYEAYYTQSVLDDTWQEWDTLTSGANWWFSGAPGNGSCHIGAPCTFAQMVGFFPNAGVRIGGATQFKGGGGWTDFVGNADKLVIRRAQERESTTYDFEGSSEVPEPGTVLLMSVGLGGLLLLRRRNAKSKL